MSSQIYNWKRFWCPRIGSINLSDGGYLHDPDSEWGHICNPDVVPFESIAMVPCLALLGEPGIGKTSTMKAERKAINTKIEEKGDQTLWLDLRSYGSEDRFVRNLFENTTFFSWAKGKHRLHVFLDSLDECLLRIDNLAALLIDEFKKYPVERLYLRIACRTADWRNSWEEELRQLWGNDAVEVYELAPLRRVDVVEAAEANSLDADAFLNEVDNKEVVPFAIKPITLKSLLNLYRSGQLPSTQADIYIEGCRLLCEETNEGRRGTKLAGDFTAEQRMAVASRIAAVTVFAKRNAILRGADCGEALDEDVTLRKLHGGRESVNSVNRDEFEVNEAAVNEALSTGLFSSRGPNRMGWAHQTYAEFLAARYLVQHEMTLVQMMNLIVHPGDPEGKLVPQLHEAAAWLAAMVPDVFRRIMRTDPEVLLRSDVETADVEDRAALVDILLRLYEEEKLLDRDRGRYRKLAHPGLDEQLRPYIRDDTKGVVVRRVAIDMAEACKLQALQNDLVDMALDPSQPLPIRVNAAYAVGRIGDDETKAKLKPLATGEAGDDPDDELKGCGLQAVWPAHITVEELFAVLTPPKQESLIGAYRGFASYYLVEHLQPSDLPTALQWIEEHAPLHKLSHSFDELVDAIMLQAWEHLESPDVLEAFAKATLSRLKHRDEIVGHQSDSQFGDVLSREDTKRRRILEAMLPLLSDPEKNSIWLVHSRTPMVLASDVPWMIERLQASKCQQTQRAGAQLIGKVFDWREPGQLDAVLRACVDSPILAETFVWLLKAIELNSPEAQRMKARYQEQQKWQERDRDRPLLQPPPTERIAMLLDECESGNCEIWWLLNRDMTLEPDSTHYGNELESDLTVVPGWKTADAATRARIVRAAKKYVLEQDPQTHKWLGTNTLHRPAFAGYRALRLLFQEAPGFVSNIPADVWKRWAPIILSYPTSSGVGDEDPHHKLVRIAYQHAPDEVIETLMILIDKENREDNPIFITDKVEGCWDDDLGNALLVKAKDEKLKPKCMGNLLTDLLDHKVDEARVFAESLVPLPSHSNGERRSKAIVAAGVLMTHAEDAGWSVVWPVIQQEVEFGREVISAIACDLHRDAAGIEQRVTETQLADLYIWLVRQYPHSEDPKSQVGTVGVRKSIADFRNSIIGYLEHRGTHKACEAIRIIAGRLPELAWLKWTLAEAQNIFSRRTWVPPRPDHILELARNQQGRLVQSGDQLLDVLIESLERLQSKLQGENPAARDIWDSFPIIGGNAYRPIDENGFSNYVKRYLGDDIKQRGIVVNREVEIRRGEGSGRGERTDIHVDAVLRGPGGGAYDSVATIIELKGCWDPKLNHAMKTQLVDRYLKDNPCQHGLYLVGWFNCDQWDNADGRKRRVPKIGINEAQERFDVQAAELSQQGTRIRAFVMDTALR